jgi:hypothetical protein
MMSAEIRMVVIDASPNARHYRGYRRWAWAENSLPDRSLQLDCTYSHSVDIDAKRNEEQQSLRCRS